MHLSINQISFFYQSVCALENITFEANTGEILGIIGPNGSGKTTLLKCINKVLTPLNGTILINETDLAHLNRKEIAKIMGVVPQISKNFPLQVLDVVLMGRYPHIDGLGNEKPSDFEAAKWAMSLTGIINLYERYIDELSGGELQRVIIARALAQEPEVLLLDEPTTHLDVNHELEILELIKAITREKQLITILVSHNLNMAARYCDKLILLNAGKVHSIGTIQEVLTPEKLKEVFHIRAEMLYHEQIQSYQITTLNPL
ncbi:MAG TPA: ABC transporter ATP-binding protein [Candidatus Deferrimicrobium sp.]|nr:ABC transporter ATP-binding protein [Candidatus Deferrimicrobium sp.]